MADLLLAYQSLFAFVGINGLLALSVYTTLSCGQLSLANAGFMAIGAYTSALITLRASGVPFIAALAASALLPAIVAVPLGLPVLRLRGVFLAIATVGFGEVVRLFFVNWDYTNGAMGLVAIPQRTQLWAIALALALALFILGRLRGSRAGYALEAIREDETAARTMGIYTTGHKLAMLALGAALAGPSRGPRAHLTLPRSPSPSSSSDASAARAPAMRWKRSARTRPPRAPWASTPPATSWRCWRSERRWRASPGASRRTSPSWLRRAVTPSAGSWRCSAP